MDDNSRSEAADEQTSQHKASQYRVKLVANNYIDLKAWVKGLNSLISNKTNLMKLADMIEIQEEWGVEDAVPSSSLLV